jgi:CheY-like chemotaxis protein
MNAIIGMTAIAQSSNDPQQVQDSLGKIRGASTHLLGVINDVLDMSKIETDRLELAATAFSYRAMLERVSNVAGPIMQGKHQQFRIDTDSNLPDVFIGDDLRLAQVLTNLLNNATKFTPEGGLITLVTKFSGEQDGVCSVQTIVADSGIGISEEQRERLFTSFTQAESSTAREFGGTGLGLAISQRIIGLMGGNIWVESELGAGSTFGYTVLLKRGDEAELAGATSKPLSSATADDFSANTILLVEDIAVNSEIVIALLDPTNINIDLALNGIEAVEKFEADPSRYDIIFMDIQMPKMDGYEATRQIRALGTPEATTVPIIAMSANVFKEDIELGQAAGMNDHIGKPINVERVLAALRTYLA